jgi:hypothetical protein
MRRIVVSVQDRKRLFFGILMVRQINIPVDEARHVHGPEPHDRLDHLPWELVLKQPDVMMDIDAVRAQETTQAMIDSFPTLHNHVLHQEASIKEHHVSEVVIADTCHYILVVEAADTVCCGGNREIQFLQDVARFPDAAWQRLASPSPPSSGGLGGGDKAQWPHTSARYNVHRLLGGLQGIYASSFSSC